MGILRVRSNERRTDEEVEVHGGADHRGAEGVLGGDAGKGARPVVWDPASLKLSPPHPTSKIRRVWGTPPDSRYGAAPSAHPGDACDISPRISGNRLPFARARQMG
jgi:hypothetical protein